MFVVEHTIVAVRLSVRNGKFTDKVKARDHADAGEHKNNRGTLPVPDDTDQTGDRGQHNA